MKPNPRIYTITVSTTYPFYIAKAEKKGRTKEVLDEVIRWLTGYSQQQLESQLEKQVTFDTFSRKHHI